MLGAVALAVSCHAASATARKRAVNRAMKEVAEYLGNTPAVCRASYVDPRLVDSYHAGSTIRESLDQLGVTEGELSFQGAIEEAVVDLLDDDPASGDTTVAGGGKAA